MSDNGGREFDELSTSGLGKSRTFVWMEEKKNEAVSDVNKTLDGSTYPKCKVACFEEQKCFHYKLETHQATNWDK